MPGHNFNEEAFGQGKYGGTPDRLYDASGNITFDSGATPPTDGTVGYAQGAIFIQTDAGGTATSILSNSGTASSSVFSSIVTALGGIPVSVPVSASNFAVVTGATNQECLLWTAPINCTILGTGFHMAQAATAVTNTATLKKATSTTIFASGTTLASAVNIATAVQYTASSLVVTQTNLAAGDRIGLALSTANNPTGYLANWSFLITPR